MMPDHRYTHIGRRKPFHKTPWLFQLFGYLPWRRKEIVRSLIILDKEIWQYYTEKEKIEEERYEDEQAAKYGW